MLYLHIGTGKAGSTTIQHWLNSDSFSLCRHKQVSAWGIGNCWKLAAYSGTERSRNGFVDLLKYATQSQYDEIRYKLIDEVRDEVKGYPSDTDFIASSEYIWGHYGAEKERIYALAKALISIFGRVKIIFYCRDQAIWASSVYAQRVKGPSRTTKSFAAFMREIKDLQPNWDYYGTLSLWAEAFGEENIRANMFLPESFYRSDLIADFLLAADDDLAGHIPLQVSPNRNISPSNLQIDLIRYSNLLPGHWRLQRLRRFIRSNILSSRVSNVSKNKCRKLSNKQLETLYRNNARFNSRFLCNSEHVLPEAP